MKQATYILLAVFLSASAAMPVLAQGDESFTVRKLTYTNQVLGNFVYGIEIQFELDYQAQKGPVKDSEISVFLFDKNNHQIASHAHGEVYRDGENHLRIVSKLPQAGSGTSTHRVFVPYYAISLLPGTYELRVVPRIKKLLRDDTRAVPIEYDSASTVQLEMPALTKVALKVSELSVEATNLDGKSWDGGSLGIGKEEAKLPDLRYRISYEDVIVKDMVYTSSEVENSLQATWAEPSDYFYIGAEDRFTLEILDADGLTEDNRIGQKRFLLKDLQPVDDEGNTIAGGVKVAAFDRVLSLTLEAVTQ